MLEVRPRSRIGRPSRAAVWERARRLGRRSRWLLSASLLGLVLAAPSCEGRAEDEPVVLRIGTREVRQGELERAFWEAQRSDRLLAPDSSGLRRFLPKFLDDLLSQEIARREIPELEPVARARLDEYREQRMVEELREEAYLREARPKEAEIRRAYERLGRKLRLRYMLVPTRERAETVLDAVRQGAVFAKVAEHESIDAKSRGAGGDIGWIVYYDLDPSVRDSVFDLEPGGIGGPFPWNDAWQIFQVVEAAPNPARGTLESERPQLRQGLSMSRVMEGRRAFVDELFRKYRLEIDPAEVAWMTAFLREKTASVPRNIGSYSQDQLEDPEFRRTHMGNPFTGNPIAPADSGRVLATFVRPDGATEKVPPLHVVDQLMTDAPFAWPTFEKTDNVESLIRELVLERLEIAEAERRGIGERPSLQTYLQEREGQIRARYFYRTRLRPRAAPSPEEVRAYYDAHPEEFRRPEERKFQALNAATEEVARRVRDLFREGKTPTQIRSALLTEDPTLNGTGDAGTPFLKNGQSPLLDPYIFPLPLRGVSEPIPVDGRFTVVRVLEIRPAAVRSFEEEQPNLFVSLNSKRTEELQRKTIEEARPEFPVKIEEEALRKVRFRPPGE